MDQGCLTNDWLNAYLQKVETADEPTLVSTNLWELKTEMATKLEPTQGDGDEVKWGWAHRTMHRYRVQSSFERDTLENWFQKFLKTLRSLNDK